MNGLRSSSLEPVQHDCSTMEIHTSYGLTTHDHVSQQKLGAERVQWLLMGLLRWLQFSCNGSVSVWCYATDFWKNRHWHHLFWYQYDNIYNRKTGQRLTSWKHTHNKVSMAPKKRHPACCCNICSSHAVHSINSRSSKASSSSNDSARSQGLIWCPLSGRDAENQKEAHTFPVRSGLHRIEKSHHWDTWAAWGKNKSLSSKSGRWKCKIFKSLSLLSRIKDLWPARLGNLLLFDLEQTVIHGNTSFFLNTTYAHKQINQKEKHTPIYDTLLLHYLYIKTIFFTLPGHSFSSHENIDTTSHSRPYTFLYIMF